MRIVKEAATRRNEIIDAAQELFLRKGYEHTTIQDILDATGIAKGTFYYYFKSKEAVRDAISQRMAEGGLDVAEQLAGDSRFSATERLFLILLSQKPTAKAEAENLELRQKALTASIAVLAPVVAKLLAAGNAALEFTVSETHANAEMILTLFGALFVLELPGWQGGTLAKRAGSFVSTLERLLGVKPGRFDEIRPIFINQLLA